MYAILIVLKLILYKIMARKNEGEGYFAITKDGHEFMHVKDLLKQEINASNPVSEMVGIIEGVGGGLLFNKFNSENLPDYVVVTSQKGIEALKDLGFDKEAGSATGRAVMIHPEDMDLARGFIESIED